MVIEDEEEYMVGQTECSLDGMGLGMGAVRSCSRLQESREQKTKQQGYLPVNHEWQGA